MATQLGKVVKVVFPTHGNIIESTRFFSELLEQWPTASPQQRVSLLHIGFTLSLQAAAYGQIEYDWIDRILFYLGIADGWANEQLLRCPEDGLDTQYTLCDFDGNLITKSASQIRRDVALKAFEILCQKFFKVEDVHKRSQRFGYPWDNLVSSKQLFSAILNFFKVEKEPFGKKVVVRNLSTKKEESKSHGEKQVVNFLVNFIKLLWMWEPAEWYHVSSDEETAKRRIAEMRSRVDSAKPWSIEVLNQLDELDILRQWMLKLDTPCLAKLEEIALRAELTHWQHPVINNRRVTTLNEACIAGSKAGWFMKEYHLMKSEQRRLSRILASAK